MIVDYAYVKAWAKLSRTALIIISALCALLLFTSACTNNRPTSSADAAASASHSAASQTPQRLISLAPSLTETIYDLGIGNRLIAATANDDYPPEVKQLPQIGDINVNWEALLSLKPDAVIIEKEFCSDSQLKQLKHLGLPVVSVRTKYLRDLQTTLPALGKQLGCPEQAEALKQEILGEMNRIQAESEQLPLHPSVYIDVYHNTLMSAGKPSLLNELVELAGGTNVYGDLNKDYPTVSAEDMITRNPQVVVLTSLTLKEAQSHPLLSKLPAIQNGDAIEVNPSLLMRPTKRSLQGVKIIHDYFTRWCSERSPQTGATSPATQPSEAPKGSAN